MVYQTHTTYSGFFLYFMYTMNDTSVDIIAESAIVLVACPGRKGEQAFGSSNVCIQKLSPSHTVKFARAFSNLQLLSDLISM